MVLLLYHVDSTPHLVLDWISILIQVMPQVLEHQIIATTEEIKQQADRERREEVEKVG